MLQSNFKFNQSDNELASFSHILASHISIDIILFIIANGNAVTKEKLQTLPHKTSAFHQPLTQLKAIGVISMCGSGKNALYEIDEVRLKQLSVNYNIFIQEISNLHPME